MGRKAYEDLAKYIISARVNASEYKELQKLAKKENINISSLLRRSLGLQVQTATIQERIDQAAHTSAN